MIPLFLLPLAVAPLTDAEMIERIPLPPIRFRGDVTLIVHFVEPSKLYALCGRAVEVGKTLLGCASVGGQEMWVSNSCLSLEQLYAKELCHEAAHAQPHGWPADHGP